MAKVPKRPKKEDSFHLSGNMPPVACANCRHKKDISIVPYHQERGGPMLAVLLLCKLCQSALGNHELGANLEIRVAGQDQFD